MSFRQCLRPSLRSTPTVWSAPLARRHVTTATTGGSGARTLLYTTALAATLGLTYAYATDTRASVHQWLVPRLIRLTYPDAEDAHHAGVSALKAMYALNMHPRERAAFSHESLGVSVFGTPLANPVGISAGLDKHADIPDALFALGAAVVEVGGCTPVAQEGNPRPRVFRVPSLQGMVNRYGLNSLGADDMALRLRQRVRTFARQHGFSERDVLSGDAGVNPGSLAADRLLAVQIAKNKETDENNLAAVAADYVYCTRRLAPYADVLVVNVSSPNTPGLRNLQAVGPLTNLLGAVVAEAGAVVPASAGGRRWRNAYADTGRKTRPRVMVKVSPDEDSDEQVEGIVRAVCQSGVDGIIVGNTTKSREGVVPQGVLLRSPDEHVALAETGGYSGPAMFERTRDLVGKYRKLLDRQVLEGKNNKVVSGRGVEQKVIFATGGITNGKQALEVLNAGASVAMVYTGLVYGGVGTITRIKQEME